MNDIQTWLEGFITTHGGVAGTVHAVSGGALALRAAHHIPEPVLRLTRVIPKGKGMAGLAWEREAPVTTCNLQTDDSGDVRPGARAVDAQAAVALPVRGADGEVALVVGIAFAGERELPDETIAVLQRAAAAALTA